MKQAYWTPSTSRQQNLREPNNQQKESLVRKDDLLKKKRQCKKRLKEKTD